MTKSEKEVNQMSKQLQRKWELQLQTEKKHLPTLSH
jgi:hypothetical protein